MHPESICGGNADAFSPSRRRAGTGARSTLAIALLAIACSSSAGAAPPVATQDACALRELPEADRLVHVPFETVDGRIYVQARVNGQGPFRFAVDTGASGMGRADRSLATALSLTPQGQASTSDGVQSAQVETTRLASVQLGGLQRTDLDVITRDYNSRNSPQAAFSGILAREFFADGLLVIDYPARTLSFSRVAALSPSARNTLPYERAFRVPVSIGTVKVTGNLDTGANVAFVLPQSLYDQVATGPTETAGRGRLTNGDIETRRAIVHGPFRVGAVSLSDVEVRVSDRFPELLVGAHALQDAAVLIDQRAQRVAVCVRDTPSY